jgi:hypothetical protein
MAWTFFAISVAAFFCELFTFKLMMDQVNVKTTREKFSFMYLYPGKSVERLLVLHRRFYPNSQLRKASAVSFGICLASLLFSIVWQQR